MRFEACLTPLFKIMFSIDFSPAYRNLNKKIGQANHFIITILVGLDEIIIHNSKKPAEFRTSWDPQDKKASVVRSREYALKTSLTWAISTLNCYLDDCNRILSTFSSSKSKLFSEDVHEIDNKINTIFISTESKIEDGNFKLFAAMCHLSVLWERQLSHSSIKSTLDLKYERILTNNQAQISKDFCGLDINRTIESFKTNKSPTMKEVTAFIRSICGFANLLDTHIFNSELNLQEYATFILDDFFKKHNKQKNAFPTFSTDRQTKKLKTLLENNGFSEMGDEPSAPRQKLEDDFFVNYANQFKIAQKHS